MHEIDVLLGMFLEFKRLNDMFITGKPGGSNGYNCITEFVPEMKIAYTYFQARCCDFDYLRHVCCGLCCLPLRFSYSCLTLGVSTYGLHYSINADTCTLMLGELASALNETYADNWPR